MTGRDLISASLRLLGVLAIGETPSADEAKEGLSALNRMLDSWSNEELLVNAKIREVFPLVSTQQTYTMGVAGNFNTSRAQKIETALIQLTTNSPVLELPMEILTKEQFAAIILKGTTSAFPIYLYADSAYPLENISVWPVPTAVNNLVLYSWKPFSDLANLDAVISLQPGFERALVYSLAVELAPEYGRQPSELVMQTADTSRAWIKRMNTKPSYLRVDDALQGKPAVWDWRTGGFR